MVENVISINGKPFDARDFNEENQKALAEMLRNVAEDVESGVIPADAMALTLVVDDDPTFWFSCREGDLYVLHGATDAMRQTFYELAIKGYDHGE